MFCFEVLHIFAFPVCEPYFTITRCLLLLPPNNLHNVSQSSLITSRFKPKLSLWFTTSDNFFFFFLSAPRCDCLWLWFETFFFFFHIYGRRSGIWKNHQSTVGACFQDRHMTSIKRFWIKPFGTSILWTGNQQHCGSLISDTSVLLMTTVQMALSPLWAQGQVKNSDWLARACN